MSDLEQLIRKIVRDEMAKAGEKPDEPIAYISPLEYARRWSISERTVRAAIAEKRLEHVRVGRSVRIPATAAIGKRPVNEDDVTEHALTVLLGGKAR